MNWIIELVAGHSIAHNMLILSGVIALGIAIGHIRIFGISLGIAGVLFSGLLFGHFHLHMEGEILEFVREFGLILFVFTIGMHVGPSFFASFRKQGLKLNLLAAMVVLLGVGITVALYYFADLPLPVAVGLLSGAVTNTPGLGAAQQALREGMPGVANTGELSGMAYAVAYPFGIIGIILTMLVIRKIARIDLTTESEAYEREHLPQKEGPVNYNIEVTNNRLVGQQIRRLAGLVHGEFVISRLLRGDKVMTASADTVLQLGDILHVVCTRENAEKLGIIVGDPATVDVRSVQSHLSVRKILITHKNAVGKSIAELDLINRYGTTITRILRAGVELVAHGGVVLNFGDQVTVVGDDLSLKKVAVELGDSVKQLNLPNILPIFIGIALGVVLGSLPIAIPGIPAPVKLGLAGGPLLVAILLTRIGRIGPVIWYLPQSANLVMREIGITLFLACVGLKSGGQFLETLLVGDGLYWMGLAALITLVPLLIVGAVARWIYRVNYLSLCGLLAGSMTDPPALSFSQQMTGSDAPAFTYASVYALVMFLRILTAQALVLLLV
ncbi:MAG TPA: putative transporter [Kiritimatiellia bacterium]|nr:putative transporter [Kiritimatiellia bacterium]HMP00218.1 putative transporter [Kiritimatiellia bacterium]HMP96848.1 putative transporter [Kiritimatiellia bacterium]